MRSNFRVPVKAFGVSGRTPLARRCRRVGGGRPLRPPSAGAAQALDAALLLQLGRPVGPAAAATAALAPADDAALREHHEWRAAAGAVRRLHLGKLAWRPASFAAGRGARPGKYPMGAGALAAGGPGRGAPHGDPWKCTAGAKWTGAEFVPTLSKRCRDPASHAGLSPPLSGQALAPLLACRLVVRRAWRATGACPPTRPWWRRRANCGRAGGGGGLHCRQRVRW